MSDLSMGSPKDLQIALTGFGAGAPDGNIGPKSIAAIVNFRKNYLLDENPSHDIEDTLIQGLEDFDQKYPIHWGKLACACENKGCQGFGDGSNKGQYINPNDSRERYHCYEYPGIHKCLIYAVKGAMFWANTIGQKLVITCGYRCRHRNDQLKRVTTNHMGKAIDLDLSPGGADKKQDAELCEQFRQLLKLKAGFQIGWEKPNMISLEPGSIAPTWIHIDVREFDQKFLIDKFFTKN